MVKRHPMLQLNEVRKVFAPGTPDEKIALNRFNLTVYPGEMITIIGSNGAGKSTLMNIIAGVLFPDEGTIEIAGYDVTELPEYERSRLIGRVFQDPQAGTSPNMTIEENMAMAFSRNRRRTLRIGVRKDRRNLFREKLKVLGLGLENRLTTKVGALSGGERQALSLLMATFTEPSILLLDEHTAALDPKRAAMITEITHRLVTEGHLTTLMVTHNMKQAIDLGDRLIMMDHGEVIMDVFAEKKKYLTVEKLLSEFERIRGESLMDDRVVLN